MISPYDRGVPLVTAPMPPTPYTTLAAHYDAVMAHVDYPDWAQHYRRLWRLVRNRPPRRVLELAAGTGRLAAHGPFRNAFTVHTDLAPEMLRLAHVPHRAACDARVLPFAAARFDAVLMAYDSLNYLTRPGDLESCFAEVRRVLEPGGLFLFDVTTAACSRRWFADTVDVMDTPAGTAIRHSRYDAETRTQLNLFTFFTEGPDGRFDRAEEVHRQRIWPAAFLKKTARAAGFTVHACLAEFTLEPGGDRADRLHFVLQKP